MKQIWRSHGCPQMVDCGTRQLFAVRDGKRPSSEGHSTLDRFLVPVQVFQKKDYSPALGFSEALKPWALSLLFI